MQLHVIFVAVIVTAFCTAENSNATPEVTVAQGRVIGKTELSENGRLYHAFRGIPYAAPPIGELRFEPPRSAQNFRDGVLDGTTDAPPCAQAALGFDEGEEDCLFLSIYIPETTNTSLPVLVWLHGGAFVTGSSMEYSPHLMMDKDLVLVVPQYRLGFLGFYSTHSQYSGGNYGLLDQLVALKWVNQNIAKFGGDPARVTLGGDCAGGISSLLHMMSPLSEGLFHRVVSLSGSPLSHWALHPRHNRLGLLVSKHVKCPAYDIKILMQCLRERSAKELLEAQKYILEARDLLIGNHKLAPSVQIPAYTHVSTLFLEKHPLELLRRGEFTKIPVLLGITRDIGSYLVDMALYDFILMQQKDDSQFLQKLIKILIKELDILDEDAEDKFKQFYLPNWNYDNIDEIIPQLSTMLGDGTFNAALLETALLLSSHVDTRLLRFEYENGPKLYDVRHESDGPTKLPPISPTAVSHGDELFFLFPNGRRSMTNEQKVVSNKMLDIIDNFVHEREPLKNWPLFTANGLETTLITGSGDIQHGIKFAEEERLKFLSYIFRCQHEDILKELSEAEHAVNRKDEL